MRTNCRFFQPQAALSAKGGIETQYQYRVATPHVTMLYKTALSAQTYLAALLRLPRQPGGPQPCCSLLNSLSLLLDLSPYDGCFLLPLCLLGENDLLDGFVRAGVGHGVGLGQQGVGTSSRPRRAVATTRKSPAELRRAR